MSRRAEVTVLIVSGWRRRRWRPSGAAPGCRSIGSAVHPGGARGITLVELMVVIGIVAILLAIALVLYQDSQAKARLVADRATLDAMRSAITIYYGKHNGNFPGSPGAYVAPSPPIFQCRALAYSYSPATGLLSVVSSNTATDCP